MAIAYTIDDYTDPWRQARFAAVARRDGFIEALAPPCRRLPTLPGSAHGSARPWQLRFRRQSRRLRWTDWQACVNRPIILAAKAPSHRGELGWWYLAQNLAMASPGVCGLMLFGSTPAQNTRRIPGCRAAREAAHPSRCHDRARLATIAATSNGLDEAGKNDTVYIGRFVGLMTTLGGRMNCRASRPSAGDAGRRRRRTTTTR